MNIHQAADQLAGMRFFAKLLLLILITQIMKNEVIIDCFRDRLQMFFGIFPQHSATANYVFKFSAYYFRKIPKLVWNYSVSISEYFGIWQSFSRICERKFSKKFLFLEFTSCIYQQR